MYNHLNKRGSSKCPPSRTPLIRMVIHCSSLPLIMTVSPNAEMVKYYKISPSRTRETVIIRGRLLQCITILIRGVLEGEHFVVFYYLSVW
jgi:hypothetical protein